MLRIRARFTLSVAIVLVAAFGGCSSSDDESADPVHKQPCLTSDECNDDNPCTAESCGADGICARDMVPDGPIDEVKGDCQSVSCINGVANVVPDSGDVENDGEPCTLEKCSEGTTEHLPHLDGVTCSFGGDEGECRGGRCMVACTPDPVVLPCDDDNPCTLDACLPCMGSDCVSTSICSHELLDNQAVPGVTDDEGDCRELRCVDGAAREVLDPTDAVVDGDPCTEDLCVNGLPQNPDAPDGASCGAEGRVCAAGLCAPPCVVDGSCLGIVLYSSYDGGSFKLDVDVDLPRLAIGITSYEPLSVTLSGAYVSKVEAVHYAGAAGTQTTITGIDASKVEILDSPPVTLKDPTGYDTGIICNFTRTGDHGGCNSAEQVADYFEKTLNGKVIVHNCQYDMPGGVYPVSSGGSCL